MYFFKCYLTHNAFLNKEIQKILANDKDSHIRELLSENINLDKETQIILANDKDHYIKYNLLKSSSLTKEAQLILFRDKKWCVESIINSYSLIRKWKLF